MKFFSALCVLLSVTHGARVMKYQRTPFVDPSGVSMNFKKLRSPTRQETGLNPTVQRARFQQYFKGVPVYDGWAVAPLHGVLNGTKITGHVVEGIEDDVPSVMPKIPLQKSLEFARMRTSRNGTKVGRQAAKLYIWVDKASTAKLVYLTDTLCYDSGEPTPRREIMIVDANDATVYMKYDGLTTLPQAAVLGTAEGDGGNAKTGKYHYGSDFKALQITEENGVCYMEIPDVLTCSLGYKYSSRCNGAYEFTCPISGDDETNGAFNPENDAHAFGTVVFDMYSELFNAKPIFQQLELRVHYGRSYENAFWDGTAMTFGDGATTFYPLVSLDVVSHEVSHGVTEQNSGLEYHSQCGGINEAFSDMAGEAAKYYLRGKNNWLVGEEIFKGSGALRYFEKPSKDGRSIDDASEYYDGIDVHYSSGVYNRAFYLMSIGTGYDTRKAFEVMYEANRVYWSATADYDEAACGCLAAAVDIGYPTQAIEDAFKTVKVDTSGCASTAKPVLLKTHRMWPKVMVASN